MKPTSSIQFKAAFLLVVFALNTVVGFACSVGMDIGFNSKHHDKNEETEAVVHIHKDGKKHIHEEKKESHSHDKAYKHDEVDNTKKSNSDKGNCCTDKVKSFQDIDKSVATSQSIVHPVFFTAFLASYYNINLIAHTDVIKDIKPFVRTHHPPIPDIRIAIQSFQI